MVLKYATEVAAVGGCPPVTARPVNRQSYRFVHNSINDRRNFLPVAKLSPQWKFSTSEACCASYALSLFDTTENAKAFYANLKRSNKNIEKTIGTHLAEGGIEAGHGIACPVRSDGHFSFFEDAALDMVVVFRITEDVRNA